MMITLIYSIILRIARTGLTIYLLYSLVTSPIDEFTILLATFVIICNQTLQEVQGCQCCGHGGDVSPSFQPSRGKRKSAL